MSENRQKAGEPENVSRRDFFGKACVGAFALAAGAGAVGLGRAVIPRVTPDPSQKFKIGIAQDFPKGTTLNFDDEHVVVFRDADGFHAISTVCTHLGCIVSYEGKKGFECACHGSTFGADGSLQKGPAPSGLPWLEMSVLPNGQLAVNKAQNVPAGTKLTA